MKRILALIALVLVTPASAEPVKVETAVIRPQRVLPPVEFDHEFKGTVTFVMKDTQDQVRAVCPKSVFAALGCAFLPHPDWCIIMLAKDDVIKAAGYSPDIVRRHERGHCNGWPADHRGARELPR